MRPRYLLSLVVAFLCAWSLYGQGTTSRAQGVVQDPTGAAIAGAKIQLINEATRTTFNTQSSGVGAYVFEAVQPASYTIVVEAAGFKKFTSRSNVVNIGQPATLNVSLEVGDLSQQIEVASTAEAVQTSTSGNFGNLISQQALADLSVVTTRGRNPLNLVITQPGVVSAAPTRAAAATYTARAIAPGTTRWTAST